MSEKRILAMAVGPTKNLLIRSKADLNGARPYIEGLIDGLTDLHHQIGTDYVIDYRERDNLETTAGAADGFKPHPGEEEPGVIFGMSTTVVRAARGATEGIPILGIVSDQKAESFSRSGHISGVSGRRSQTAGACFERFLATVPTLKSARVFHKPGYGPSERSLKLIKAVGKKRGVGVTALTVRTRQDLEKRLAALPKRDLKKPAEIGVLVPPIDVCLSAAPLIIDVVTAKNLPLFFCVPDWVKPHRPSALGAFGVSQLKCGELVAGHVDQILWQGISPKNLKVREAPDDAFEWVVSKEVAEHLRIKLPHLI